MATQTSNLGLTKPAYDEAADIVPAVNNNMDTLDSKIGAVPANSSVQGQLDSHTQAIAKLDESIAIVSDGNTHAAIAAGQYVYVKNHGTLTEGLYTANSAISTNATLSSSNVTAVSGGGLNALNSKIASYADVQITASSGNTITADVKHVNRVISGVIEATAISGSVTFTLNLTPSSEMWFPIFNAAAEIDGFLRVRTNGNCTMSKTGKAFINYICAQNV